MNVAKFSGNIFVNFAVSSTVETVACLFCMMGPKRFGRKKFLCISMLIGGSTCLCTIFTTLFRVITVFTVFRLLTDFVCLYNYEFWLSLCKIVRSSVILLLPLFSDECKYDTSWFNDSMLVLRHFQPSNSRVMSIILIGWWNRNSWKIH